MTGRPSIVEFLRARLDEDERVARAAAREAGDANWTSGEWSDSLYAGDSGSYVVVGPYGYLADELKAYLVTNDPARVRAEVEAKRRIIERAELVGNHGPALDHVRAMDMTVGASAAFRDVLWFLALPYADHPDYDPAWAPEQVET